MFLGPQTEHANGLFLFGEPTEHCSSLLNAFDYDDDCGKAETVSINLLQLFNISFWALRTFLSVSSVYLEYLENVLSGQFTRYFCLKTVSSSQEEIIWL